MDKRGNKFIFKDFKMNLIIYFIGIAAYLLVGKILIIVELIEKVSGGEIVGACIFAVLSLPILLNTLTFLKGNNILRKNIWTGLGLNVIVLGFINSFVNLGLNKFFNTIPIITAVTGHEIPTLVGGLTSFCIVVLIIKVIWIYFLVFYKYQDSIIKGIIVLAISLIGLFKIQNLLLVYVFTLKSWNVGIISGVVLVSLINFYCIKKFEINGEMRKL